MKLLRVVDVRESERAVLFRKGRFVRFLGPGRHRLWGRDAADDLLTFDASASLVDDPWAERAWRAHRAEAEPWIAPIETAEGEIAVVWRGDAVAALIGPARREFLWRAAPEPRIERFDAAADPRVPARLIPALRRLRSRDATIHLVRDGEAGLLTLDGVFAAVLEPGAHAFWSAAVQARVATLDLRPRTESFDTSDALRSADGATVNLLGDFVYRIADPKLARDAARDMNGFRDRVYDAALDALLEIVRINPFHALFPEAWKLEQAALRAAEPTLATLGVQPLELRIERWTRLPEPARRPGTA